MAYDDYLFTINKKVEALFNEISAEHNFEYGDEFEIALCKVFRFLLPNKFGVCRGYVVTSNGIKRGDDLIIYDQDRFPTLRLLDSNDYSQLHQIPIEAVYAYIEAKHTLVINGDGRQSLTKAITQVMEIKNLERAPVPLSQITPKTNIQGLNIKRLPNWPKIFNPIYGAIISRYVKINERDKPEKLEAFLPALKGSCTILSSKGYNLPDLIIAGSDSLVLPAINSQIESPFFIQNLSKLITFESIGKSYGVGLTTMLYAIDSIELGQIHWPSILASGLNLTLNMGD